jgi:hypothetical protein
MLQKLVISADPNILLKVINDDVKPILFIDDYNDYDNKWEEIFIVATKDQVYEYIKDYETLIPYNRSYGIKGDVLPKFYLHLILRAWTFTNTKDVDYLIGQGGKALLRCEPQDLSPLKAIDLT